MTVTSAPQNRLRGGVGETDILIRHENRNLFVAECKNWVGARGFSDTTDPTSAGSTGSAAAVIRRCFVSTEPQG